MAGTGESFVDVILNSARIIGNRGVGMQASVADPGQRSTPAVADDTHFACAVLAKILDGRRDVGERLIEGNALNDLHALLAAFRAGGKFHIALSAVKQRGRNRQISSARKSIGNRTDMRIDAENFLQERQCQPLGSPLGCAM